MSEYVGFSDFPGRCQSETAVGGKLGGGPLQPCWSRDQTSRFDRNLGVWNDEDGWCQGSDPDNPLSLSDGEPPPSVSRRPVSAGLRDTPMIS